MHAGVESDCNPSRLAEDHPGPAPASQSQSMCHVDDKGWGRLRQPFTYRFLAKNTPIFSTAPSNPAIFMVMANAELHVLPSTAMLVATERGANA